MRVEKTRHCSGRRRGRPKRATLPRPSGRIRLVGAPFVTGRARARRSCRAQGAPEIAFAGRSNAGKSSAINALANHGRLAFASRTPGRTQQINLFALRGGALVADLPGYGYAAVAKRSSGLAGFPLALRHDAQRTSWRWCSSSTRGTASTTSTCRCWTQFVPSGRPVLSSRPRRTSSAPGRAARSAGGHRSAGRARRFRSGAEVDVQLFSATTRQGVEEAEATIAVMASEAGDGDASKRKAPRSRGVTRGLEIPVTRLDRKTGTRSGRVAGDVHRLPSLTGARCREVPRRAGTMRFVTSTTLRHGFFVHRQVSREAPCAACGATISRAG